MKGVYNFLLLSLFFIISCSKSTNENQNSETNPNEMILGNWHAKWEKIKEEEGYLASGHHMDGSMVFTENQVEITAFGFDGCIFFADTAISRVKWKIENDVLRLIDFSDDQGLPYNIEQFGPDEIKLSLMDDVFITLNKN